MYMQKEDANIEARKKKRRRKDKGKESRSRDTPQDWT